MVIINRMVIAINVVWVLLAVPEGAAHLAQSLSLLLACLLALISFWPLQQFLSVLFYQPFFVCGLLFSSLLHGVCQLYLL